MGEFTDNLTNAKGKAIPPIGSTHYQLGDVSFYVNRGPKDLLQEAMNAVQQQLQQTGQFAEAQQMAKNPQPFFGNPHAMAVFMAAAVEVKKSNARIEKLEKALAGIVGAITESEGMDPDSWFEDCLRPACSEALAAVQESPP